MGILFNNGGIAQHVRHEQDKMNNYNHLFANPVILRNVNTITKVIRKLNKEGLETTT